MNDYIKREDAKNMMRKFIGAGYIPPNEDVVEVVRCKDCEHGHSYNMFGSRYCLRHNDVAVKDNDYCRYGERAET